MFHYASVFHLLVASQGAMDIPITSHPIHAESCLISSAAIQQSCEKDLNLTIIMLSVMHGVRVHCMGLNHAHGTGICVCMCECVCQALLFDLL